MNLLKKFGPHYAIERFGVMFLSLALAMAVLISSIVVNKIKYDSQSLSGMARYTTTFSMSLSGATGTVRGVYTNEDHTKCFLLLKFDDMTNIPVKAEKYKLFLSAVNKDQIYEEIESNPNAMIYQFGSTGYMGIYLYSAEPFPSQILNLYLRATEKFSNTSGDGSGYEDATFSKYDQACIYFNPGGTYATKAEFLETDDWSVFDIYEELVSRPSEIAIRQKLVDDLKIMRDQKLLIYEYTNRVVDDGLTAPEVPSAIANDKMYAKAIDTSITTEKLDWSMTHNVWFSSDGATFNDNGVRMYLDTKVVEPGGYNYQWQESQIKKGYLKDLTGSDKLSDWKAYLDAHANDTTESTYTLDSVKWTYTDGTLFVPESTDSEGSTSKVQTLSKEVEQLKSAWNTYWEAKVKYQTVDLAALLQLEYDAKDIETSYTINANESGDLLTLW